MREKLGQFFKEVRSWASMSHHSGYSSALRATTALLKFWEEHDGLEFTQLRVCLAALQSGDREAASKAFRAIHMGHHGAFDWFPPVVFGHETPEYVQSVFEALVCHWQRSMEGLLKKR